MMLKGKLLKQAGNKVDRYGPISAAICPAICPVVCSGSGMPLSIEDDIRGRVGCCVNVGEPAEEGRVEQGEEKAQG
jgi:hypothetical protein